MAKNVSSQGGTDSALLRTSLPDGTLLDCNGDSTIGRLRTINQDHFFMMSFMKKPPLEAHDPSDSACPERLANMTGYLFGVADGIGGAPAGDRASLLVSETLKAFIGEEGPTLLRAGCPDGEIVEIVRRGLRRCQAALSDEVARHPESTGMGTTLTAAVVLWPRLYLFHMGDSRAYLLRERVLRRLTRDQTYARSLVDARVLDSKSADRSKWRHVVWNVLGGRVSGRDPEVHPEVHIEDLQGGDILLLCTDGLTNPLNDETIRGLLLKGGSAGDLCSRLTHTAREMKARDDATAVIARIADSDADLG